VTRLTKILAIALAVSVALNVFFLGFWATRAVRRWHEGRSPDSFEREMDRPAAMRGMWKTHGPVLEHRRAALDIARRAVREALVAEPFQPQALEAALAKLRGETDETQAALHRALVQMATELSPEERRRLADSTWFVGPGRIGGPRAR